jgi:hypothetical protein
MVTINSVATNTKMNHLNFTSKICSFNLLYSTFINSQPEINKNEFIVLIAKDAP